MRLDPADWHAVDDLLDALVRGCRWDRACEVAAAEMQRVDGLDGWDAGRARWLVEVHNTAMERRCPAST